MAYSNDMDNFHRQSDYHHSDYRNRAQMSSGQQDRYNEQHPDSPFDNNRRDSQDWDSSRGYGSNLNRDYDRGTDNTPRTNANHRHHASYRGPYRYSNDYGGPRNNESYRDYPTHRNGRSNGNIEDDEMRQQYERRRSMSDEDERRLFGGRDYERYYPTRAERDADSHTHDRSEGWQSNDSQRGYRSLNNTGRTGIGQDNQLGREHGTEPNTRDQNYSRGDYRVNLSGGGQEYNSRHYYDRDRPGTVINEYAQRGYSQGYGRTAYSTDSPSGEYVDAEVTNYSTPKNYKGDDERIYVEVCEALGREMDAKNIEVTCTQGEITLTGSVKSKEEKRQAERIADHVMGVHDIHNRLKVDNGSASQSGNSGSTNNRSENNGSVNGSGKSKS